jgi:hypothetical protein
MLRGRNRCAGAVKNAVRSNGGSGSKTEQRSSAKALKLSAKVEAVVVPWWRPRIWNFHSFFLEVVARSALCVAVIVCAAMLFVSPPTHAQILNIGADTPQDVSLTTGRQLGLQFDRASKDPDVKSALALYAKQGLEPNTDGLALVSFLLAKSQRYYELFFIPTTPSGGSQPLILYARLAESNSLPTPLEREEGNVSGVVSRKVFTGTIVRSEGVVEVKDEQVVAKGDIQPSKGQLKNFFKCAAAGCAPAGAGCLLGGPEWLPCFCLWCGGSVAGCGITELFFP